MCKLMRQVWDQSNYDWAAVQCTKSTMKVYGLPEGQGQGLDRWNDMVWAEPQPRLLLLKQWSFNVKMKMKSMNLPVHVFFSW